MITIEQTVRSVLARHTGRLPSTLHARQRLERDLHLTPLEIVLVILEVEQILEEFLPIDEAASLHRVGDLIAFVSLVVPSEKRRRSLHGAG
jgi:acyl carrier protein